MNKFKVGDRVKVKGGFGPAKGTEGVVVEVDTGSSLDSVLCRFKNFEGHNGNGRTRRGKDFDTSDHWYLYPDQIELISRPNKTKNRKRRKNNEFFMWTICRKFIDNFVRCNDECRKLRKETRR